MHISHFSSSRLCLSHSEQASHLSCSSTPWSGAPLENGQYHDALCLVRVRLEVGRIQAYTKRERVRTDDAAGHQLSAGSRRVCGPSPGGGLCGGSKL